MHQGTTGRTRPVIDRRNNKAVREIAKLRALHPDPLVYLHPDTAAANGIEEGDWVWLENKHGKCKYKAAFNDTYDPRVLQAEHGWWFPEQDGEAPNYFGVFKAQITNLMPHEHIGKLGLGAPYKCLLCKIRPVSGRED